MVLRVFDYMYQDAKKYQIIAHDRIRLDFPESKIIYLEHNSKTPDVVTLELNFQNQGVHEYKVPTMKFLEYSSKELSDKHMVIMLPLYLLKLRKEILKDKSKKSAKALKSLIEDDIIKVIEDNIQQKNITHDDAITLYNLLKLLYNSIYGDIDEFRKEGVDDMLAEKLTLYTEEETLKTKVEIVKELLKLGLSIEDISTATKLTSKQIVEIQKEK